MEWVILHVLKNHDVTKSHNFLGSSYEKKMYILPYKEDRLPKRDAYCHESGSFLYFLFLFSYSLSWSFSSFLPSRSAVSHLIISLTITPILSSFWFLALFLLLLFLCSPLEYSLKCVTYLLFLNCSPVLLCPEWFVLSPDCYHWSSTACPVSGCRGWLLLKTVHQLPGRLLSSSGDFLSHAQMLFCSCFPMKFSVCSISPVGSWSIRHFPSLWSSLGMGDRCLERWVGVP